MKLIDSHCHLDYDFAPKSSAEILKEGREAGIVAFLTIGTGVSHIGDLQKLSDENPDVFHTVGIHPHEAELFLGEKADPKFSSWRSDLALGLKHPKCKAVGEIGLDYYYEHSARKEQQELLDAQLTLAQEAKLPIVVHSREGEADLLPHLQRFGGPGVIHCFSGTMEFGKRCLDLGFYISFSGILTFKKAEEVQQAARAFPLDRILVETDAPYLAPIPHRGKKCEPSMVKLTALKLAELKGLSLEEVAEVTTQNSINLFNLPRVI